MFCYLLSLWAVAVHAAVSGFAAGLPGHSASHLYGQSCLRAPLDSAAQLLSSCFYRDRERQWQSVSQDIKTSQVKWWRTHFCTSPNTKSKPHTWLRCDRWCAVDRDGVIWRARHTWFCSHRMERIQQFLVLDALHLYLAYRHAIVSFTHDAGWFDGLRTCTEPELGMTWPNSSTCVSILWAEQFTTVIKKKLHVKCNNHNCDFQTGNVCNVLSLSI